MVGLAEVLLTVEALIVGTMIVGSYYGRQLNMRNHHRLIYGTILVQGLVLLSWMIPNISYWSEKGQVGALLIMHMMVGGITAISSLILAAVFLKDNNEYDLPTLRWTKPLMIFTFFSWILAFILGFFVYLDLYIFV